MKIVLETKPNTDWRETELRQLKHYLHLIYKNNTSPFGCHAQCDDETENCYIKCVEEYIQEKINEINEEGVLYL